jgi:hypothetical protein
VEMSEAHCAEGSPGMISRQRGMHGGVSGTNHNYRNQQWSSGSQRSILQMNGGFSETIERWCDYYEQRMQSEGSPGTATMSTRLVSTGATVQNYRSARRGLRHQPSSETNAHTEESLVEELEKILYYRSGFIESHSPKRWKPSPQF